MTEIWSVSEGEGPVVSVAIHYGHSLRNEVNSEIELSHEDRLREEDPFTGFWTQMAATRIVANRSRFEVDLNRPRDRAIYLNPKDAWGLKVWKGKIPKEVVTDSLNQYDEFYKLARTVLDRVLQREGHFVVFDLHSYNHHRNGSEKPFDSQKENPDIIIGTGNLDHSIWGPLVECIRDELQKADTLGRHLDIRENVKFSGGYFPRWVNDNYQGQGCAIALEFKKFFMDEWTGQLHANIHKSISQLLTSVANGVKKKLGKRNVKP